LSWGAEIAPLTTRAVLSAAAAVKAIDLLMALREFFREFEARGARFGDEGLHGLSMRVAPEKCFSVVGAIQMPNESDNSQI
jgi:hypothetical protein